jgi:SAM-dependent MidA family methyltransferase
MTFSWLNLVRGEAHLWTTFFGYAAPLLYAFFICQIRLKTLSQLSHSRASVKHVHLVESSPALRTVQEKKLRGWSGKSGPELHWHESIEGIPTADGVYTMLVAHEFFDALPFHLIEVRRS